MKNILFIAHSGKGGGADSVLSFAINNTFKNVAKYKRFVVYPKFQGFEFEKLIDSNVSIKSIFYRSNSSNTFKSIICDIINIPGLIYLVIFCYIKKINVVYVNASVNFIGAVLATLIPAKVIWHIHEQPNDSVKIIPDYIRIIYKRLFLSSKFDLIFVSRHSKESWEKVLALKLNNDYIVYPPVKALNNLIPIKNTGTDFCFGYLGALVNEKNIMSLLEAFKEIVQQRKKSKINLVISGNGLLLGEIILKCDEFGITDRVEILKYNNDVSNFFSKIDALVQPSFNESWGLVALEAMSYGKAVVMTRESGLKEILVDGTDCLFINPLDKKDIEQKMNFLLDNKLECAKIASNGFLKYKSFDFNNNFNKTVLSLVGS